MSSFRAVRSRSSLGVECRRLSGAAHIGRVLTVGLQRTPSSLTRNCSPLWENTDGNTRSRFSFAILQTLIEIGVDKNTTVVFPEPSWSTIQEDGRLPFEGNECRRKACPTLPTNGRATGGWGAGSRSRLGPLWEHQRFFNKEKGEYMFIGVKERAIEAMLKPPMVEAMMQSVNALPDLGQLSQASGLASTICLSRARHSRLLPDGRALGLETLRVCARCRCQWSASSLPSRSLR